MRHNNMPDQSMLRYIYIYIRRKNKGNKNEKRRGHTIATGEIIANTADTNFLIRVRLQCEINRQARVNTSAWVSIIAVGILLWV